MYCWFKVSEYLRTSGDGNNGTTRAIPGDEMCRPGETKRMEGW